VSAIRIPKDSRWASVREEVEAGRLWKARDRLQGHFRDDPANADVLDMLGAVHFAMGDLPLAARYWWLTERDDEHAVSARSAFHERFGTRAANVLGALPRPAAPEHYPPGVRARLEALVAAATDEGVRWGPSDWRPLPGAGTSGDAGRRHQPSKLAQLRVTLLLGGVVALMIIGVISVVGWLIGLVT